MGKGTEIAPPFLDMVEISQSRYLALHHGSEVRLSLKKRQTAQVYAVDQQRVKGDEEQLTAAKHKVFELWSALGVERDNLAVKHGTRRIQACR